VVLRVAGLRSRLAGPFDLAVHAGECVAISGESGSGKSLFLRMLADLDPSEGSVTLRDQPRGAFTAPAWRRQVVYNAAETGWWDERVAAHFPGPHLAAARALAPRLGLNPALLDGPVLPLSTGERQRVALMRALLLDPPVLLLDEPTGALDAASTTQVEAELRVRLDAGTAVVLVTHSPHQAARLADRHFVMRDRRLSPGDPG
jgi:ABC-type iron transport system FetAB ATPase subunit